jgi:hypothetical protein
MEKWKSQKQIDNEKDELIKQLRKQNTEMLEMFKKIVSLESIICLEGAIDEQYICEAEALNTMMYEAKQLIKEATEL